MEGMGLLALGLLYYITVEEDIRKEGKGNHKPDIEQLWSNGIDHWANHIDNWTNRK